MLRASRLRAAASRVQARRAASVADVELLRDEAGAQRVDSFDAAGFVISGKRWRGGVLTYLDLTLCWRALRLGDVTPEAPELLVVGAGERPERPPAALTEARRASGVAAELTRTLAQWLRAHAISLEWLDTANAVSTFNVLAQENRRVAGAFLPLSAEAATAEAEAEARERA